MPYLIDGNNLLGSWGGPRGDDGRAEVVRRVAAFCRARGARALIVFDGHPLRHDMDTQTLGRGHHPGARRRDRMRTTSSASVVENAPRAADLIVVTSDKALYSYVKTLGASILRAHEWNALERRVSPARPRRARSRTARPTSTAG